MTAAATYPYDDNPPRLPSVEDLGGDAMIDDAGSPPGAGEPSAAAWNNFVRLLAASGRMLPTASIVVTFDAGAPVIESVVAMRTTIAAADFTLTDNGTGDTTIEWAATVLPSQSRRPKSYVCHTTPHVICASSPTGLSVQVETLTHAGVAADVPFTVDIF